MAEGVAARAPISAREIGVQSTQGMSFASVAAMAPTVASNQHVGSAGVEGSAESSVPVSLLPNEERRSPRRPGEVGKGLDRAFARMDVKDDLATVPDIPEHDVHSAMPLRPKLDDEKTQLSFYSTTAPSIDGKSVASGTTFGLDEKESLRPDDSASVKATEDDDSNSGPASGDPNSRGGSEAGMKAFSSQFTEISDKMPPTAPKQFPWARKPGLSAVDELRRSALASQNVGIPASQDSANAESTPPPAPFEYPYQSQPDDKLLEAMESPKDRLFVLQLEQDVILFIRDSTEPLLNLPPCNSFYRLLAHRLGDYYALSHFVDNSVSHVKLYRTPYCRLRTPLSEIAQKLAGPLESRPALPSMKIMRRFVNSGEDQVGSGANTTDPSLGPSNTGSEVGDDSTKLSGVASPTDSAGGKDKPALSSREEREAKYKEVRERIFGDFKEGEKPEPSAEDGLTEAQGQGAGASKKKKKNRQLDDSFDSRSQYNLYFPSGYRAGQIYEQGPAPMANFNGYVQQPAAPMYHSMYQQPYQQYPPMPLPQQLPNYQVPLQPGGAMVSNAGMYPPPTQAPHPQQYGQPIPTPYYNPYQQPQQMAGQPASLPSPAASNHSAQSSRPQSQMSDQGWSHGAYQNHFMPFPGAPGMYQPPPQPQMLPGTINQSAMPYPYGQLPFQPSGSGSRPAHPVPGSYNRQNFNPHSRVFVPGQFDGTEQHGEPCHANPSIPYPGGYQPIPQGTQLGQMRTPPNTTLGSSPRKPAAQSIKSQSPGQSYLSKWGTPANLPAKPPPPVTTDEKNDENRAVEQPRENGN